MPDGKAPSALSEQKASCHTVHAVSILYQSLSKEKVFVVHRACIVATSKSGILRRLFVANGSSCPQAPQFMPQTAP